MAKIKKVEENTVFLLQIKINILNHKNVYKTDTFNNIVHNYGKTSVTQTSCV